MRCGIPLVAGQLDPLGVHQDHPHLVRRRAHQDRGDHRVDEAGLAGAGGASHEQVRHLGEVGDDVSTLDVLADAHNHRVRVAPRRLAAQHVAEADLLAVGVGDLDADRRLSGDRAEDADVSRGNGIRDVSGERGDAFDLDARTKLNLVPGHRRAAAETGDLRVDVELVEHLGQRVDHGVVGGAALLVRASGREQHVVGQRVGDVAGKRKLLDPTRYQAGRRCLEGRLRAGCVSPWWGNADRAESGGQHAGCSGSLLARSERRVSFGLRHDGGLSERLVTVERSFAERSGAAARPAFAGQGDLIVRGLGRPRTAQHPVTQVAQTGGNHVDRRGGHDQDSEDSQQQQQGHGAPRPDGSDERA